MKIKFSHYDIEPDFPGYTGQDIYEQVRKMYIYFEQGLNPFTGQPYGFLETHQYTETDIKAAEKEMLRYCICF